MIKYISMRSDGQMANKYNAEERSEALKLADVIGAAALDCYDGTIRGFKMDTNMRAELCVEAFELACRSDGAGGMILHSDRGRSQDGYFPLHPLL
jgi:transposase InsO family protein